MLKTSRRKTQALAIALLGTVLILPVFAESEVSSPETTGRAIPQETIDPGHVFARRPATLLERAPSGLAPQSDDNSCALLDEPQAHTAPPRRGSGPLGPHLLMDVE